MVSIIRPILQLNTKLTKIRNYQTGDHDQLAYIYLQSRRQSFNWLDADQFKLEDFIADTAEENILVVEQSGKLVGFVSVWEPDNFIHHLYVHPSYVGSGIGKTLLGTVKTLSYMPVKLKCMAQNLKALAFYKSQGWVITGTGADYTGEYFEMASRTES